MSFLSFAKRRYASLELNLLYLQVQKIDNHITQIANIFLIRFLKLINNYTWNINFLAFNQPPK